MGILRSGILVAAIGMGCLARDVPVESATTLAAALPTQAPPLALFVLRVAVNELSANDSVLALEGEAERASRPIAEARAKLAEALVVGVNEGYLNDGATNAERERLLLAIQQATPTLRATIERLHRGLSAADRVHLRDGVIARLDGWASSWTPKSSHAWIDTLAGPVLAGDALELDARETGQRWVDARVQATTAMLEKGPLEGQRRVQLLHELRAGLAVE